MKRSLRFVILSGLLILCGCWGKPPATPETKPSNQPTTVTQAVTVDEAAELHRLRIQSLGHLENLEFVECEAALKSIAAKLPADLFVLQNRAICRQLVVDGMDAARNPQAFTAAVQAAQEAIAALEKAVPSDAVPLLLRSRLEMKQQQKSAAMATLKDATQRQPDFAPAWYELYQLQRDSADPSLYDDPALRAGLIEAGRQVARLAPDNWFLWKDWAVDLAKTEDPQFPELLQRMRTALEPFASTYQRDIRVNPVTMIDNALKAWDAGEKKRAVPLTLTLRNILILEASSDKDALSRHSLEFLRTQFSTSMPNLAKSSSATATKITFAGTVVTLPNVVAEEIKAIRSLDADIDGKADLVVLTARRLQVFSEKDGAWAPNFGVDLPGEADAFVAADFDDDADLPPADQQGKFVPPADPEFVVSGPGGLWVFENQRAADGTRSLVLQAKDAPWADASDVNAVVLLDLDGDGDLDIFAGGPTPRWFIYRGKFLFGEVTERTQKPPAEFRATAAVAVDWDRDVDVDLIVTTDRGVTWFENIRHGRFRYHDLGKAWRPLSNANTISVRELNGDTRWDLVVSGPGGTYGAVSETDAEASHRMIVYVPQLCEAHSAVDVDNDGAVDVLSAAAFPVWKRNNGAAVFETVTETSAMEHPRLLTADDVDGDGDLDFWTVGKDVQLVRNDGGNANHWLELRPRGIQEKGNGPSNSKRVNHQAVGSLIELRVGDRYQAGVVDGQSIRFGLGAATKPDALRIVWTNGVPRAILAPKVDTVLTEEMLPIGSCPYLYTWNGERFEFCTDLLWNAPLGLKFAEDVVAGWREWEYLKIEGDRFKPRGNEYVLQMTEELWEVAYFDQVKLIAVDHPADVQIFTNEKVGPPDIAQPKIHTVKAPRVPLAARDPHGRDVLNDVLQRDGHYTKTYDRKIASGLTPEHYLELDFGDLEDACQITLFLTGWMYPTDTSLNVQFSQAPTMTGPRPPSLWAPDAAGQWREVRPFLGFPGGKTKTIALDVTEALTPGDARLRIVTNMEFYWDQAFVTVDEPAVEVREQELPLKHADLHFRGCSQAVYRPYNGPEYYDYDRVNALPQWPPLLGQFTRYGDVTPLLRERDDHLAVFGAGDEMTVTFGLPKEPLPEGWVRDFVIYNVGWDKDAVLHTVHGTRVEPLPYRDMQVYGNGEDRPRDAAYDTYLRTYQTRTQSPKAFWGQLRNGRQSPVSASRMQSATP